LTFPLFALLNRLIHSVPTIISGCCCFPYISETGNMPEYPLKNYLDRGLKVTVNADNPGISRTDFSRELHRAARLTPGGLSIWDILKIVRNGFKASFAAHATRNRLLREAEAEILDLIQKGIPQ